MAATAQNLNMSASLVSLPEAVENALEELPDEQPDELWPPPFWPGHLCKKSLLQLRDSSGLTAQEPPYSFSVRYDLKPITKQIGEKSAYLMLLDGESLRRIGRGAGLNTLAASKSWLARSALCAPPQLLTRGLKGKLTGELIVEPDPHIYANSEGVLLMLVVLTADVRNVQFWEPAGDLISVRLGSPPIPCGLCNAIVPARDLYTHQQEGCPGVSTECPRCRKHVPFRTLVEHQVGFTDIPCVGTAAIAMQTEEKQVTESEMQCVMPAFIDTSVQTAYQLPTPEKLRAEDQVASLVPSIALRWQAPSEELRSICSEYRLSISEFRGDARGDEQQWSHVRIELLEIDRLERLHHLRGELRHELDHLRPGTRYRLELKAQAPDGSLSPAAVVVVSTLSRLAGSEGLPREATPDMVLSRSAAAPPQVALPPPALAMRDQSSQAGQGFIAGACKSDIFHDVGIQVFKPVHEEAGIQCNPITVVCLDASCGDDIPVRAEMGVQCKALSTESSMQCEIRMSDGECQVQLPARLETGERMAGLELEANATKVTGKELLQYCGQAHFLTLLIAFLGNVLGLTGILLADLLPEELWPCLSCPIIIILANGLELFLFETFPTSKRAAAKLRAWRRKHGSLNMLIQAASLLVSSDALQFYRGAIQAYGRRPIGILEEAEHEHEAKKGKAGDDVEAGKARPRSVRSEAKHGAAPQMAAPQSVVPAGPCSTPASQSPPPPPRSTRSSPNNSRPNTSGMESRPGPLGTEPHSVALVPQGTMPATPAPERQAAPVYDAARAREKIPIAEGGPPPSTTGTVHPATKAPKPGPWPSAVKPPAKTASTRAPDKQIRDLRNALEDASLEDAKGTKCPVCSHVTPIPDREDALRSVRFMVYFSLPHLGISAWLLARQLQLGSASPSDVAAMVVHMCTLVFHAIVFAVLSNRWLQYTQRRWAECSKPKELSAEPELDERIVRLRWPGLEEYLCDFWFVKLTSLDQKDTMFIEMLQGSSPHTWGQRISCLEMKHVIPGHYWATVQPWLRNGGLGMPIAMGHCSIPTEKEAAASLVVAAVHDTSSVTSPARASILESLPLPPGFVDRWKGELPAVCDAITDAKPWEVVDVGTDPKDTIPQTANAEVQNVVASVDASVQFPAVPKEYSDSSTAPEIESASTHLMAKMGSEIGSFDLPVTLHTLGQPSKEVSVVPEKAKGLWLRWASHGLMEAAPRLVAHARRTGSAGQPGQGGVAGEPGARVAGDMTNSHQASFRHLEAGKYELVLSCELGACAGEVVRCHHDRCAEHFWAQNLAEHVKSCQYRPSPCPLGCDWQGCLDEQEDHFLVCPCREIACRNCERGCLWRGQFKEEPAHFEKDCEIQYLINTAATVEGILAEPCPDYHNPEIRRGVELLSSYSQYVQDGPWAMWRSPGTCCICGKYVDMKDKGLQRENGTGDERICWSDMCLHMDWERMRVEEAEIEAINMKPN